MKGIENKEARKARIILEEYLRRNNLRKTPERFEILNATYTFLSAFDIHDIKEKMETIPYKVSLSTIYNTFILLEKAHLLTRSKPNGRYSKFIANRNTDNKLYLICDSCGSVRPIQSIRINHYIEKAKWPRFFADSMTLYIHGLCYACHKQKENNTHIQSNNETR